MSSRADVPFWGLTPQQIYEQLTGGPGSGKLADASSAASREWQREEERANEIRALAEDIRSGWEGQASEAAHGAAGPLAESALQGASQLHTSEELLNRQTEVFHSAANSVVPVPENPPESNILNDMIPWETDLDQEIREYQAQAQHNIDVFRTYDTTSLDHEAPLAREYSTVAHSGGDISVRGPGDSVGSDDYRESDGPGNYSAPDGGDSGRDDSGGDAPGESAGRSSAGRAPTGSDTGDDTASRTQVSQVSPSATPGPGFQGGTPPVSQPGPTTGPPAGGLVGTGPLAGPGATGSDRGFGPGVRGAAGSSGGLGGRGGASSGGGLGGRSTGFGDGPSGRGAGSSDGPGGRGGTAGGGPGARGGAPGALAAEQPAQRGGPAGAAGARGTAGTGGVPMGATGRGRDGEDSEHQRKVMIEPDPEETFGTDEVTAPPVIGDPRYEGA